MDSCTDPIQYIQNAFDDRLQQILSEKCPGSIGSSKLEFADLKLNKKPLNSAGGSHNKQTQEDLIIPAFSRRLKKAYPSFEEACINDIPKELLQDQDPSSYQATLESYILHCKLTSQGHLTLALNRASVTRDVIRNVLAKAQNYGSKVPDQRKQIVISEAVLRDCEDSNKELAQLRTAITSMHIKHLLLQNGVKVDVLHTGAKQESSNPGDLLELLSLFDSSFSNIKSWNDSELNDCAHRIQSKLKSRKCTQPASTMQGCSEAAHLQGGSEHQDHREIESSSSEILDFESCEVTTKMSGLSNSIWKVKVPMTPAFLRHVSSLELSTSSITQKTDPSLVVHVVSCRKVFSRQTEALAWHLSSDSPLACYQVFVSLGLLSVHNDGKTAAKNIGIKELLRLQERQLHDAYSSKYGSQVSGSGWEESIRCMAVATMKIQIMAAAQNSNINMDISDDSQDFRQATFVMYNCARLAKLFQHYEDNIRQGLYPELPPVHQVDFSLLRDEDEWNLLLRFVMIYPSVLVDTVQGLTHPPSGSSVTLQVNRITAFLLSLSHDFSSYYGRVHVLGEPRQHLFPVMFARLYLLKAIQQIIHNCLALLNIDPLTQM